MEGECDEKLVEGRKKRRNTRTVKRETFI